MSLQRIKKEIYFEIDALFASAAVDEMAGDIKTYSKNLAVIAQIAKALGIDMEVTSITLQLKVNPNTSDSECDV